MIEIYIDGLSEPVNPDGIATFGYVIYRDRECFEKGSGVVGTENTSNNVAEYTAAIEALKRLLELKVRDETIAVRSDSELLINQLNGAYAVRAPKLVPLHARLKGLILELEHTGNKFDFSWIPREKNEEADALSRQAYQEYCERYPSVLARYAKHLATEKQKSLMRRLGIQITPGISIREASRLISEKLKELGVKT